MNHRSIQTLTPRVWLLWLLWGSIVTDRRWMIDNLRKYEIRSDGGGGVKDRWWQGNKTQRRRIDSPFSCGLKRIIGLCRLWWHAVILVRRSLKKTFIWDNFQHQLWVQEVSAHLSRLCLKILWFVVTGLSGLVGGFLYLWPPSDALWSSSCLFFLLDLLCNSDIQ